MVAVLTPSANGCLICLVHEQRIRPLAQQRAKECSMTSDRIKRRTLLGGAIGMASFAALPAWAQEGTTEFQAPVSNSVRNNVSSFRMPQWQDYFENTRGGAILADTKSRALHYWSEDQSIYRLYPSSVPLSEELTRLGRSRDCPQGREPAVASDGIHARAQPGLAEDGGGWSPGQPTRCPGTVSVLASLLDPRHP